MQLESMPASVQLQISNSFPPRLCPSIISAGLPNWESTFYQECSQRSTSSPTCNRHSVSKPCGLNPANPSISSSHPMSPSVLPIPCHHHLSFGRSIGSPASPDVPSTLNRYISSTIVVASAMLLFHPLMSMRVTIHPSAIIPWFIPS